MSRKSSVTQIVSLVPLGADAGPGMLPRTTENEDAAAGDHKLKGFCAIHFC